MTYLKFATIILLCGLFGFFVPVRVFPNSFLAQCMLAFIGGMFIGRVVGVLFSFLKG